MLVRIFTDNGFYYGFHQQFICYIPQDTARLMIGMLQNKLQTLNIICTQYSRMNIYVIEFNINEFRLCAYVKRMCISWCNHKQVSVMVWELVVVYPLNPCACQDINQFKKSMVMLLQCRCFHLIE